MQDDGLKRLLMRNAAFNVLYGDLMICVSSFVIISLFLTSVIYAFCYRYLDRYDKLLVFLDWSVLIMYMYVCLFSSGIRKDGTTISKQKQ